jgi:ribosomal protein S18 acetylase RimI-like enzyme
MDSISFISGDEALLDAVKELWEALNEHHLANTKHFSDHYSNFTYQSRKDYFIKKAQKGTLMVDIAVAEEGQKRVGYCISSVDEEKIGEIESIYVFESYRTLGVGRKLVKKALDWMDELGVVKKIVSVASGNENAFGFYEKFGFYPRKTVLEQL